MVNQNELKVIKEISRKSSLTQRELSEKTKLSLGAVNVILKRLVKRGIIKTRNLNPKKIDYILTPKGISEKTKKSYNYILKTINLVKLVREEIARIVLEEYNRGQKKFIVLGNDDLADIIELSIKGFDYERIQKEADVKDKNALVLIGNSDFQNNGYRVVNVAERLGEVYWGVE
jgi:DNA-binding MarR family transcriptional regulator